MPAKGKKRAAPKKANGYKMPPPFPVGELIHDNLTKKTWRLGPSIGVGGFGEIYSACDNSQKGTGYPYVIKIEPIENGPLFVEKHFYVRNAIEADIKAFMKEKKLSSLGMPRFYGSGPHEFNGETFRFLVLERYGTDIWKLFKEAGTFKPTTAMQLALQILDVLEYIQGRGYAHADVKGGNVLTERAAGGGAQAYLVDYGLASRLTQRDLTPDPRAAHNGTIEYTSRDAHAGMTTMRGDLEIVGYNVVHWVTGALPWLDVLGRPAAVHQRKQLFMGDVRRALAGQPVPDEIIRLFEYVNTLEHDSEPDFDKVRPLFEKFLEKHGKTRYSKFDWSPGAKPTPATKQSSDDVPLKKISDEQDKKKRGRKPRAKPADVTDETNGDVAGTKRKSAEPAVHVQLKRSKPEVKATPPPKRNHAHTATQTSDRKLRPRNSAADLNVSKDLFDDSSDIEKKEKIIKPRRKLLSKTEVTTKVVKTKRDTVTAKKTKSWRDTSAVRNGKSPPK